MKNYFFVVAILCISCNSDAQIPSKVDYDAFQKLTNEVKNVREKRLINYITFRDYSYDPNTIILDTRSKEMFDKKHLKGAINLNFSDFTQSNLAKVIPNKTTRILIYCNNNIADDSVNFPTKMAMPEPVIRHGKGLTMRVKPLTLALNIPTFINLYGYGYENIYELSEFISIFDNRAEFEGTEVVSYDYKNKE